MRLLPVVVAIPAVLLTSLSARAAVFVQSIPFNLSTSGTTTTGPLVSSGDLTGTVDPFNPSLGTLTSFSVVWHMSYTLNWTNDSSGENTESSFSGGGNYSLNGTVYNGDGGGNGNDGPANASLTTSYTIDDNDSFTVANAGVNYSPALLAAVTGGSPFPVVFDMSVTPSLGNVSSWSASAVGSVTVSYTYTAVPEPLSTGMMTASLLAMAAGLRRRQQAR
ncbi:MAG TPA: PEP-CTERM sorting domain-containing protein [Candidatus Limnocylindria bacterium]|jgi:hypothetical protein|nr:PEP-CTERM sorting domain-containing protein [Candidatus Limnocylindria bacterium]